MPLYGEMAVIVFNMADEPLVSVNRELVIQIIEIVVILDNNERDFSVEDADFVHRRLDQMWREVFQVDWIPSLMPKSQWSVNSVFSSLT